MHISKYRISCKVSRAIFYNFSLLGATTFKGRLCIKGDYVLQIRIKYYILYMEKTYGSSQFKHQEGTGKECREFRNSVRCLFSFNYEIQGIIRKVCFQSDFTLLN